MVEGTIGQPLRITFARKVKYVYFKLDHFDLTFPTNKILPSTKVGKIRNLIL